VTSTVNLEAFETPTFYDRLQRVESQAVGRPLIVVQSLVSMLGGVTGAAAATIALVAIEPLLLPLVLLGAVPSLLAARRASRLEYRFAVTQTPRVRLRDYYSSLLTGRQEAGEVRAYETASFLSGRYEQVNEQFLRDYRAYLSRRARLLASGGVAGAVALAAAGSLVAWFVAAGIMDVAAAAGAIVGARLLGQQVSGLVSGAQAITESGPFLLDLEEYLSAVPARPETTSIESVDLRDGFDVLEVDDLWYRYPGSDRTVLKGVCFTLRRGEIVALVGENGSGKTTLAKVIAGLLPATRGSVRFDGVSIEEDSVEAIRRSTAFVFQDFLRFQLSARDNVILGDVSRTPSDDAVATAARHAGAWEALARLPQGLDTVLSKAFGDGVDLSTGTWQRVALARAFYRDAPFLLLDEPSAALDARAEHALFAALRTLAAGRTVFFVSHRFATVRDADRILVLHDGQLVEMGGHDDLVAAGGRYADLFRLQAEAYLDVAQRSSQSSREPRTSPPRDGS
jgi:ATP-binding cassette subfamily B protein